MTMEVKPVHRQLTVEKFGGEHKPVFRINVILAKQYGDRKCTVVAVRAMKGSTLLVVNLRDRLELLIPSSSLT